MNGREIAVFGLGVVGTGLVVSALYYWSPRNQPVTVSDETHVEEVNTEEESQRPSNSGCVFPGGPLKVRTGAESKRPLNLVPPEVSTEEILGLIDSDSSVNDLEPDGGKGDGPPSYEEQPPSYSSNVYTDAEPTDQDNQQPPSRFEVDAVILYASHDEEKAKECKEFLKRHVGADVGFFDDVIRPGSNVIDGLCELLLKCRLVLVFHTKNLKNDGLIEYGKYINLLQAIEDTDKKERIIPLLADDEVLSKELRLYGYVSYYDEHFLEKMSKLFTDWRNKLP